MWISSKQYHAGLGAAAIAAVTLIAFNHPPGALGGVGAAQVVVARADPGVDARLSGLVAATDAVISARITVKLDADAGLDASKIRVQTQSGHAALRGSAPDVKSRARAEQLAGSVKGVLDVYNQLVVAN